jgi:hypothetical protein
MRGRLGLFLGFGAGYVLGAKAGTERYEQLRRLYDNVKSSPTFQRASGKAMGAVGAGLGQAKDVAAEGASKVGDVVRERRSGNGSTGSLSVAPPPNV